MNIITIFNYPDEYKYNNMFKVWLLQALKCKINTNGIKNIKILTEGLNDNLYKFIKKLNYNFIKVVNKSRKPLYNVPQRWLHNVGFKLYNLCLETEPFVFVDADAIIMTNMNDVVKASTDKPFISVNHQTIPRHTDKFNFKFMNTGFFIVSNPEFLDFDKIYKTQKVFKCPGTDQFLLNNYCKYINYDYTHPLIHYGWNSCGGYKLKKGDNIFSYGLPEKHKIHILHYWDIFKPWITKCSIYEDLTIKYILFEKIIDKIKFTDFEIVLRIFDNSYKKSNYTIYTNNKYIYNYLKILNLFGKTNLIDNINTIDIRNDNGNYHLIKQI